MRKLGIAITLGLSLAAAASARADGWDDFWCGCKADYYANKEWPTPFVELDRQYAVAPYAVMIAKGWERQNLIGDNFFDPNTQRLNYAGVSRVREILLQAPPEHSGIFVARDLDEQVTSQRVLAVQQAVAAALPRGPLPAVVVSNMQAEGRLASIVSAEFDANVKAIAQPRIAGSRGAGGGGTASGGTSGPAAAGAGGADRAAPDPYRLARNCKSKISGLIRDQPETLLSPTDYRLANAQEGSLGSGPGGASVEASARRVVAGISHQSPPC